MKKTFLHLLFIGAVFTHASVYGQSDSGKAEKRFPAFSVSAGTLTFLGDVGYAHLDEPFLSHGGFQLAAQFFPTSRFSPQVYFLHGALGANEKTTARTLNFHTNINAFGAQVMIHLTGQDGRRRTLVPYITAGIEYLSFTPKGDLVDANGAAYHYWSDGTIRDIAEGAPNADNAQLIHRDYVYETNLREANLDGVGNYSLGSVAIPAGLGVRMNISKRCALHLASVVHFTFTDNLDNVSDAGSGQRQGDSKNDKFVYSSVSFSYDLSAPRETPKPKKYRSKDYKHIDFNALAKEDADRDGINDLDDESPDTPPNVAVDAQGRPLDADQDGVPDYRDKEMTSAKDALVTEEGVTLTDALIEEQFQQDSIANAPSTRESIRPSDQEKTRAKGIPEEYKKVDLDGNGVISSKEITEAIDAFLAGKSSFDTDAFYKLIDFYFSQ